MRRRFFSPRQQGFTLLELMITLAVAGILLGIAVPSFANLMERNRLTNFSNELLGNLTFARNEARDRNSEVQLCSSANGTNCDGAWNIDNPLILRQSDGTILRRLSAAPSGTQLIVHAIEFDWNAGTGQLEEVLRNGEGNAIRYDGNGQLVANASGRRARRLCLTLGGEQTPFSLFQSGQVQIQPGAPCN